MKYHPDLQPRDWETLRPLAQCYRVTTAAIEARRHGIALDTARKRLDRLTAARFACRLSVWASPIPPIDSWLGRWSPGEPEPDFGAWAYDAQHRWDKRPLRKTTVYTASKKLLAMFSLPQRPPLKRAHATHDLGLTETYFFCRRQWPQFEFIGEDLFSLERGHGEAVEDAQLVDGEEVVAVIEFAGSYRKSRVEHIHHAVAARGLPYFLF